LDVAAWLSGLGLGQYGEAFARNGVDGDVLPLLRPEDLRELGVAAVGHRRKLLDALAKLRVDPKPSPTLATAVTTRDDGRTARIGERRQLTVMFVDLIGFTELSVRLDPEELRDVLRAYQEAMAAEIARFGGSVSRFLGDGVLAYFGFPHAHEDDAERAVCAALAIVEAVKTLRTPDSRPLYVRVGIATGLVVVGDLIGSGPAREQAAVGETPNLAARLQALAEPGAVVIADRTRQLIGRLYECVDLGCRAIAGFQEPLRAWRVVARSRIEGRFEARQAGRPMPLVGRDRQLGCLLDLWQRAKDGTGQVALLAGEPGIGKSRLIRALVDQLLGEPYVRLHCRCSPLHASSPLYPVIDHLERAAGLAHQDCPVRRLDKLEALLALGTDRVAEVAPLFAAMLSIPSGDR
jgi:class 3 adenylate cyclase